MSDDLNTPCSICKSQGRDTGMFKTASGVLVCPICDKNQPVRKK